MKNKVLLLCLSAIFILFSFVLMQGRSIRLLGEELDKTRSYQSCAENYIWCSFRGDIIETTSARCPMLIESLNEFDIAVFIPQGICRACFSSLLFQLQDNEVDTHRVTLFSEANDSEIKSECISRSIHYTLVENSDAPSSRIIIARKYRGFLPIVMNYTVEDAPIFHLFLSEEESLIAPISNRI